MKHPTNLGPRQRRTAHREAEMIANRADGVLRYIREGQSFVARSDEEAIAQLLTLAEDADRLVALLTRAGKKKKKEGRA